MSVSTEPRYICNACGYAGAKPDHSGCQYTAFDCAEHGHPRLMADGSCGCEWNARARAESFAQSNVAVIEDCLAYPEDQWWQKERAQWDFELGDEVADFFAMQTERGLVEFTIHVAMPYLWRTDPIFRSMMG